MMITEIRSSDPSCNWVWREPTPNSSQKTKLTAILRGGEKTETAKNLIRHVQTEQEKIAAEGFWVDWGDQGEDEDYGRWNIRPKFIERADHAYNQILTGQYHGCLNCRSHPDEFTDLEKIQEGFPQDRNVEFNRDIYEALEKDGNGRLLSRTGDWQTRFGVTQAPVSIREIWKYTLLHKNIHLMYFDVKLLEIAMIKHKTWILTAADKKRIKTGPRKVIQEALAPGDGRKGVKFDFPSTKGGGNSTTGVTARTFYRTPELVDRLVALYPDSEKRELYKSILTNNSLILRLAQCNRRVDIQKIDELCTKTSEQILTLCPFAKFTPTIHELYAHLAQSK